MLPALDAALLAARTPVLQRAACAFGGPVDVEVHAVLDRGEAAGQGLPCRAAIDIVVGQVDEVLLAEASLGLGA
jgi:hypothetical protein